MSTDADPVKIEVDVLAVDSWVRRTERDPTSDSAANGEESTAVEAMMTHLEAAKERQRERLDEDKNWKFGHRL